MMVHKNVCSLFVAFRVCFLNCIPVREKLLSKTQNSCDNWDKRPTEEAEQSNLGLQTTQFKGIILHLGELGYSQQWFSLALHKDWKQGETASLTQW